jgi:hypothetical protein
LTSSPRRLRVLLAIAAAGAVVVLLSFLGRVAELAGVVAIVIVALLAAPRTRAGAEAGVGWPRLLGTGAVLCAIALPLSLLLDTIGGLLAGIGGALVIVAVAFAWPTGPLPGPPAP